MRKGLLFFFTILLVTSLIVGGCAKPTPTPAPAPAPAPTPAPAPPPPEVIELKLATWMVPMAFVVKQMFEPWAKKIESLSNGRVRFTFYCGETLVKGPDDLNAVLTRTCDIAHINPDWTPGVFPLSSALPLPLIFDTSEASAATFMELFKKYPDEYRNVKLLWTFGAGPSPVTTSKKQVKTLEDFKGLKMAVTMELGVKAMERVGAIPVPMPIPEVYTALERGMVDGYIEPWEAALVFKFLEVTKYRTAVRVWTIQTPFVMNLDCWNSLPPDIQKIFDEASGTEWARAASAIFDAENKRILQEVIIPYDKEKGNPPIYYLPEDEIARWGQAFAPVMEEWIAEKEAKGLPARAFINDMLALAKKYNQETAGKKY